MPIVRPMIGAANTFTAGKLIKQLKTREIPYTRTSDDLEIGISFTAKNGKTYQYGFNKENAMLRSKKMTSDNRSYETIWRDGEVDFSMQEGNKRTKIQQTTEHRSQNFLEKLLHRKKANYSFTQTEKNVLNGENLSGWTKKLYKFPTTSIVSIIPHCSYKIRYSKGFGIKFKNVTEDTIEKAINQQINSII